MMTKWLLVWKWLALAALAAALVGCNNTGGDKPADATGDTAVKSEAEGGKETAEAAGPPMNSVPAEVKTAGYEYYGLDNVQPIEYQIVATNLPSTETGSATNKLIKVENGVATFVSTKTGTTLASMGDEEVEARKDGIYYTKIGGHPVEPPQLVLPAELTAGKSWTTKGKVTAQTQQGLKTFDQNFTYKVAGVEKVKIKAGEYEALKVTAKGEIVVDGQSNKSDMTAWYVKGLGTVKMEIVTTGERKGTMTIEATKTP